MTTSVKELAQRLDKIKKKEENKKCFDCGEKGTTYACITFGTFICSRCAGILRELNYKVKGTGVSIFNQTELDLLDKMGNENAEKIWLAKYKKDKDKSLSGKSDDELRKFIKDKYQEKKWYKKPKKAKKEDSDDEDEKETKKGRKNGGKKNNKEKKRKELREKKKKELKKKKRKE